MSSSVVRFGADNRGTRACQACGVLSWQSRQDYESTGEICIGCFEAAGYDNEHQDGYHVDRWEAQCPTCNPAREARRVAAAARRVAGYQVAATARVARETAREAGYPHCPHCGQRRPKTREWERTGVAKLCSDCSSLQHDAEFYASLPHTQDLAEKNRQWFAQRQGKYTHQPEAN